MTNLHPKSIKWRQNMRRRPIPSTCSTIGRSMGQFWLILWPPKTIDFHCFLNHFLVGFEIVFSWFVDTFFVRARNLLNCQKHNVFSNEFTWFHPSKQNVMICFATCFGIDLWWLFVSIMAPKYIVSQHKSGKKVIQSHHSEPSWVSRNRPFRNIFFFVFVDRLWAHVWCLWFQFGRFGLPFDGMLAPCWSMLIHLAPFWRPKPDAALNDTRKTIVIYLFGSFRV